MSHEMSTYTSRCDLNRPLIITQILLCEKSTELCDIADYYLQMYCGSMETSCIFPFFPGRYSFSKSM